MLDMVGLWRCLSLISYSRFQVYSLGFVIHVMSVRWSRDILAVTEAQRLIHDPEITHGRRKVMAAATLMEHCEHDLSITFDDMLRCLDYGGTITEMGARCLYVRTSR